MEYICKKIRGCYLCGNHQKAGGENITSIKTGGRTTRILILSVCGVYQAMLVVMAVAMLVEGVWWEGIWILLLLESFLVGLVTIFCYGTPVCLLDEKGVYVRFFFKTRFVLWSDMKQAGILRTFMRYGYVKDPVLLLPEGSPGRYKDKNFALRNFRKLIHLPASEEVQEFVVKHYGPLDFNLWDNPKEECIVQ